MFRAKWLVLVGLLIAMHSYGDEVFMKGVSWYGNGPEIHQMKELGANSVRPGIRWNKVEQKILDASLTIERVNENPDLVSDYPVYWTVIDNMVNSLTGNGFVIVCWIGAGTVGELPLINGEMATPDELGKENYLGCIYRHARAVVRRYKDRIHYWMIEGELNEAQLTSLFGWRRGDAWSDEEFVTKLLATLHDAVRAEDPEAKIIITFHTDIHENIHHNPRSGLLAGPYHWTEWLEKWQQYLDIVGIDCYSNYYTADPIYGTDIGDRVATAKGIVQDKPVIVFETAYPTAAPGVVLPDPVAFTEEKQAQYVGDAINSAIENGADGFFYFTIQSKGITNTYTEADLEALRTLGTAFRNGDAEALVNFLIENLGYAQNKLPAVLKKVEHGWGLLREDGSKRPGFHVLQEIFSTIPKPFPSDGTVTFELETGWNLISLPLQLQDTSLNSALASIQGEYESIWTYDAATEQWASYVAEVPSFLNNLDGVKPEMGYWVMMKNPSSLIILGERSATSIPLSAGWNLVGYDSVTTKSLPAALSSIDGHYESVWTYNSATGEWQRYSVDTPEFLNNLNNMEPGRGYWIDMSQPGTLIMQ